MEEVVTLKLFQDRHEVKETLLATNKPSDVHDPDIHFSIDCIFVSTEAEELFCWETYSDLFLNVLNIQSR